MQKNSVNKSKINMNVLLDCRFTLTREMNRRYAKITYRKYRNKWQTGTFWLSIALFLAGFLCIFLKLPVLFLILIFAGLYVFFMSWFGYLFQASVSYKDMARFYGDPIQMHVTFYEEFFRVEGDNNNFDFPYSQITDIIELNDISILIVSAKGIISHGQIIDKKSFNGEQLMKYYDLTDKILFKNLPKK